MIWLIHGLIGMVLYFSRSQIQKGIRKTICWFVGCKSICLWTDRDDVDIQFTKWECERCFNQKAGQWTRQANLSNLPDFKIKKD